MSRRLILAAGAGTAVLVIALTSLGFKRTTTSGGQHCLWWGSRSITYHVNDFSSPTPPASAARFVCSTSQASSAELFVSAVNASFDAWGQASLGTPQVNCTDLVFTPSRTPTTNTGKDGLNVIVVRQGLCSGVVSNGDACLTDGTCADKYNCWDSTDSHHSDPKIIALTTTTYIPSTGEITDADMELNGWDGTTNTATSSAGYYFTCVDPQATTCTSRGQTGCIAMDVRNTVTHEAGHFLGLAHPCEYGSPDTCTPLVDSDPSAAAVTMFPRASLGETGKRTLKTDDINGICAIYPKGQPTANCIDGPCLAGCAPASSGGCSQGPAGPVALLGLAGVFALRRSARALRARR